MRALLGALLVVRCRALHVERRRSSRSWALGATGRSTHALVDGEGRRSEALELPDKVEGRRTFVFRPSEESAIVKIASTSFYEGKLGHAIWPASVAGAVWAADRPELFRGKSVLELGSGVGAFGVAVAALTPAARVCLSDMDATSDADFDSPSGLLAAQRSNVLGNGLDPARVSSRRVDWADTSDWGDERYDVVLAADCVYMPETVEPLADALRHFVADGGAAYVFSVDRDWSDAKYERASPSDLEAALRDDPHYRVARSDWTTTTASGDGAVVLLELSRRRGDDDPS